MLINMAVKWKFSKRIIWIIVIVSVISVIAISYRTINKIQYQYGYLDVNLHEIANYTFDMSKRSYSCWMSITSREQVENILYKTNWDLPDIDFENEMFIISYGSELENRRYNLKEATFETRGKYIGFPYFKQEKPTDVAFVYRTSFIPLMDTDVAGYSPQYRGKN